MTKVTRKSIVNAILSDSNIFNEVMNKVGTDNETLTAVLTKWDVALSKSGSRKVDEARTALIAEIVEYVTSHDGPVTAKEINDKFVHSEKTNKASALLRQAVADGQLSRDRVRKNANYEYAGLEFDWNAYIGEYDKAMAEKAAARIARANANRR